MIQELILPDHVEISSHFISVCLASSFLLDGLGIGSSLKEVMCFNWNEFEGNSDWIPTQLVPWVTGRFFFLWISPILHQIEWVDCQNVEITFLLRTFMLSRGWTFPFRTLWVLFQLYFQAKNGGFAHNNL